MIAKLRGTIDSVLEDSIIIDVNGFGLQVLVSTKLRNTMEVGANVCIRTIQIFRQETQYLCGFNCEEEVNIFKALLDVPGIGVKSAISVLSTLTVEEFAMAVVAQEPTVICRAGGIGKKTAARILLELKDKNLTKIKDICSQQYSDSVNDAILGLVSLGYQKHNIVKIVSETFSKLGPDATANELIVACLKELG